MTTFIISFFKPNAKKPTTIYKREFNWWKDAREWADTILKESSLYYYYEITTVITD